MWYLIAADLVLVVHLLFIGFVVGGSFLAWRWPRLIWVQLPAMVYGALVELVGFACPLTALQNYLLHRGGQAGYRGGFISHYLIQVIYPPGLTRPIQVGLGLVVVLIAVAGYGGYLRRHPPGRRGRQATGSSAGGGSTLSEGIGDSSSGVSVRANPTAATHSVLRSPMVAPRTPPTMPPSGPSV
jgi:uncharacterized protein DUF2784